MASASRFQKCANNRLTRGGPEVTYQAGNDDGKRHEVQPERPVMLRMCRITQKSGPFVELDVHIVIYLRCQSDVWYLGRRFYIPNRRPKKSEESKLRLKNTELANR